jgi:restriction endonuclease
MEKGEQEILDFVAGLQAPVGQDPGKKEKSPSWQFRIERFSDGKVIQTQGYRDEQTVRRQERHRIQQAGRQRSTGRPWN